MQVCDRCKKEQRKDERLTRCGDPEVNADLCDECLQGWTPLVREAFETYMKVGTEE